MKPASILLTAIAPLAVALLIGQPAQAETAPKCKLASNCVYGPEIDDRWTLGQRLEATGDFEGAIAAYEKALQASGDLQLPNIDAEPLAVLRLCAAGNSLAHIEGAKRGIEFMEHHQMHAGNLKMAAQVASDRYQEALNEQNAEDPELTSRCP